MAKTETLVVFEPATHIDLAEVATWVVDGPETAELAVEYREGVKALIREIEAGYKPHVARAHAAHKALCEELRLRLLPCTVALDALNRAIGSYEVARQRAEEKARRWPTRRPHGRRTPRPHGCAGTRRWPRASRPRRSRSSWPRWSCPRRGRPRAWP
jgi:hypothetical protein